MGTDDELTQRWLSREDYQEAPTILWNEVYLERGDAWRLNMLASGTSQGEVERCVVHVGPDHQLDFYCGSQNSEDVTIYLYEDPTLLTTGTALTPRNLNRNAGDGGDDGADIWHGATLTPGNEGTNLMEIYVPGDTRVFLGSGHVMPGGRWILKPGGWYLFALRNDGSNKAIMHGIAEWVVRDTYSSEAEEIR